MFTRHALSPAIWGDSCAPLFFGKKIGKREVCGGGIPHSKGGGCYGQAIGQPNRAGPVSRLRRTPDNPPEADGSRHGGTRGKPGGGRYPVKAGPCEFTSRGTIRPGPPSSQLSLNGGNQFAPASSAQISEGSLFNARAIAARTRSDLGPLQGYLLWMIRFT